VLSLLFTFRILANLGCARRFGAAPFVHVGPGDIGWGQHPRAGATRRRPAHWPAAGPVGQEGASTGMTRGRVAAGAADRVPQTADRRAPRAAEGATMAKATGTRSATAAKTAEGKTAAKRTRSAAETKKIRTALESRREELQAEYDQTLTEIAELQRERLTDSAGDDTADTGTKTLEREQEITLANNLLERINQVERAIDRLSDGHYGYCERCGNAIPVERLAAFPSATLCVTCKQLEERR
jgi:DnaK suppressor protein